MNPRQHLTMSIIFIISIIFLLIIGILSYLGNPSNLCRIPLIIVLLIVIIYSIFDLMKYYNKKSLCVGYHYAFSDNVGNRFNCTVHPNR